MSKAKMKVVQCWDDGVLNDIRLTELLRKYNAKATFNLCPGTLDAEKRREPQWTNDGWSYNGFRDGALSLKDIPKVYEGFELASHCWQHETANTLKVEEWIQKALDARHYLEDITNKPCTGFAWPCGQYNQAACDALRENGFTYGRTTEYIDFVTDCKDTMAMPTNCHALSWKFMESYEKAKACGVFYFWGHSYELYQYDDLWAHFERRIKFISEDPEAEWANINDIVPLCKGK